MRSPSFLLLVPLVWGCSSFATLQRVGWQGQAITPANANITVSRGESSVAVEADLSLEVGDALQTNASFGAVVAFEGGASLVIAPLSNVTLAESGVDLHAGEVLFRPAGAIAAVVRGPIAITPSMAAMVRALDPEGARVVALGGATNIALASGGGARVDAGHEWSSGSGATGEKLASEQLTAIATWANGIDVPERRIVPHVQGMKHADADKVLQATLVRAVVRPVPVEAGLIGQVVGQNPGPGHTAASLTLDVGAESVLAPDVVNLALEEAQRKLEAGSTVPLAGDKKLSVARDVPTVVGQDPAAGTRMLKGGQVKLSVEYPGSLVPKLVRLPQAEAMQALTQARLTGVIAGSGFFASVPADCVQRVEPAENALIPRGAQVKVFLSKGTLPAPGLAANNVAEMGKASSDPMGVTSFAWQAIPDASDYQVQIAHPAAGVIFESVLPKGTLALQHKPRWQREWTATPYTWQVRGKANDEWGEWSPTRSFHYEPPDVIVPNLVGTPQEQVATQVALLTANTVQEFVADAPAGTVARLDPPAGTRLKPGDALTVVISRGQDPNEAGSFYGNLTNLGKGYNVFANVGQRIITEQVVLFDSATFDQQVTVAGQGTNPQSHVAKVPRNLDFNQPQGASWSSEHEVYMTSSRLQDSYSTKTGVEGRYKGFSASVAVDFGEASVSERQSAFVSYKVELRAGQVKFKSGAPLRTTPQFVAACNELSQNPAADFTAFFDRFGSHFVHDIDLGADCRMTARVSHRSNLTENELGVTAKVGFEAVKAGVEVSQEYRKKWSRFESESSGSTRFRARGGAPEIVVSSTGTTLNRGAWERWVSSTQAPGALRDIEQRLRPIYDLVQDGSLRERMRQALEAYAAQRGRALTSEEFRQVPVEFEVTIRAERMEVHSDGDTGADPGDITWSFEMQTIAGNGARGNPRSVSSAGETKLMTGTTHSLNQAQSVTVKPGERVRLWGRVDEKDDGAFSGGDDHFGSMDREFVIKGAQNQPFSQRFREAGASDPGDVTVHFTLTVNPIY